MNEEEEEAPNERRRGEEAVDEARSRTLRASQACIHQISRRPIRAPRIPTRGQEQEKRQLRLVCFRASTCSHVSVWGCDWPILFAHDMMAEDGQSGLVL
jgi:hypothetical protein